MLQLFTDPLHDQFAELATAWVAAGAADLGEVVAIAEAFPDDGDDAAYFDAWAGAGDRHVECAERAFATGSEQTARGHLMRASVCFGVAIKPWFGTPVDERMTSGFDRCTDAFDRAVVLGPRPGERMHIPFEGSALPAWFVPATDAAPGEVRPVVIVNNGYDGTLPDNHFGIGAAAAERGYHVVLFDGPGQGAMLVHAGTSLVADWERVVTAVVDAVVERGDVDTDRIALHGWSLGGYLAPRAATAEHRLAAVVADPALWGIAEGMRHMLTAFGVPESNNGAPELTDDTVAALTEVILSDRVLTWRVVKRGFWVHGVEDLRGYLRVAEEFTLDGREHDIDCPLLATTTEGDPLSAGAPAFVERLSCPTTLVRFTAAQGAGGHCEIHNRWLLNTTVLDWLDETLGRARTS
ncbi:MAG: alpha/beta fold hydrolase [Actinobacteria bacterium]|nr:alpha/beta fold hydrolase [Actinomycetota bacterium]